MYCNSDFREMTEDETKKANKLLSRRGYGKMNGRRKYELLYEDQGNMTLCVLRVKGEGAGPGTHFPGISKRNPIDPDSPRVGRTIAMNRAVAQMAMCLYEYEGKKKVVA
jgi:hypothetical protein